MEKIFVDDLLTDLNPNNGQSKPLAIRASDNKIYMLKSQLVNVPGRGLQDENAVFMQEMFVNQLALELGIPVPNFAVLDIEQEFIEDNKDYLFSYRLQPGIYFGTELIPNAENPLADIYYLEKQQGKPYAIRKWNSYYKNVTNPQVYADIIALDFLTLNADRFGNKGNLIIAKDEYNRRKAFAIDFGHCFFGPYWNDTKINMFNDITNNTNQAELIPKLLDVMFNNQSIENGKYVNSIGRVFKAMSNAISFDNGNPFDSIVYKIESLDDKRIEEMLYNIPNEWVVGGNIQRNIYFSFIKANKLNIRSILSYINSKGLFKNNQGGALVWSKENLFGIQ